MPETLIPTCAPSLATAPVAARNDAGTPFTTCTYPAPSVSMRYTVTPSSWKAADPSAENFGMPASP